MLSIRNLILWTLVVVFCGLGISEVQAKTKKKFESKVKYSKIVSLKPNITLILQALGVGEKVIGVTKFCQKPNAMVKIVADYNSVDVEAVMRLKPDLILTSSENSQSRQFAALQASKKLNLKLFEFRTYTEFKASLLAMAKLLGIEATGVVVAQGMDTRLARLSSLNQAQTPVAKLFIVMVQRHPLMVASGQTFISSLLQQTGMKNAFGLNKIAYPVLDEEEFIREVVDYTFELNHKGGAGEPGEFLNKQVIVLDIQNFLAAPQSIGHLETLITRLNP